MAISQISDVNTQPDSTRHIPYGWIILGVFLSPILALLIWANYQVLGLGLEAVFGLNRIQWIIAGRIISISEVIATATIAAELLSGFLFAELAGWISLLDIDRCLHPRQQRSLRWITLGLFLSLIAGEVGIGLYRQNVIDKQSREYTERLHQLATPTTHDPVVNKGQIDLTKTSRAKDGEAVPAASPTARKLDAPLSGWAGFIDSMPFAATIFIHVAIPCLTAAIAVIMSPLTFFICGLALTLTGVLPLSVSCVVLDLTARIFNGARSIASVVLNLIAAPVRILIEGAINLRGAR